MANNYVHRNYGKYDCQKGKTMTILEFKQLQEVKQWKQFSYLTTNQPRYDSSNPVKWSVPFPKMIVGEWLNIIFFKLGESPWLSGYNGMTLDRVKSIDVEKDILGDILNIHCGDGRTYIVIANN